MALANEILGRAARYQEQLRRRFGIALGAPSPQLTPEVTPVVPILTMPEHLILASEKLFTGTLGEAGGAGGVSVVQLSNDAGTGLVGIVEHLEVVMLDAAGDAVTCAIGKNGALATLPAPGQVTGRETRLPLNAGGGYSTVAPALKLRSNVAPPTVFSPSIFFRVLGQYGIAEYNLPLIIAPGWAVQVSTNNASKAIHAAFAWREVPLAEGEEGPF
jgi:hypothetical protein